MLKIIHQGHLVVENSRRQAREAIFWPGMSRDIAEMVASCETCQKCRSCQQSESLKPHEAPSHPWERLGQISSPTKTSTTYLL